MAIKCFFIFFTIASIAKNMRKYGLRLTRILPYKDRIIDSVLIRKNTGSENPYYCIFYAVFHGIIQSLKPTNSI